MKLENYDTDMRFGTHTIKVTFQLYQYKGYITFEKGGNCKGLDILNIDIDDIYEAYDLGGIIENTANLRISDDGDEIWYFIKLTNDDGDEMECDDLFGCLGEIIVGVEIINFVEEK